MTENEAVELRQHVAKLEDALKKALLAVEDVPRSKLLMARVEQLQGQLDGLEKERERLLEELEEARAGTGGVAPQNGANALVEELRAELAERDKLIAHLNDLLDG